MSRTVLWDRENQIGYQLTFLDVNTLALACPAWQMKRVTYDKRTNSWSLEIVDLGSKEGAANKVRHRHLKLGECPPVGCENEVHAAWHLYLPLYVALRRFRNELREESELSSAVFRGGDPALLLLTKSALAPYWGSVSETTSDLIGNGTDENDETTVLLLEHGATWPYTPETWLQELNDVF